MMQFIITAKLLSDDWFLFSILLIIFLRKTMLNLVNISTHKEKKNSKENLAQQFNVPNNSCSKNVQETKSVLINVVGCGYFTVFQNSNNIPAFRK